MHTESFSLFVCFWISVSCLFLRLSVGLQNRKEITDTAIAMSQSKFEANACTGRLARKNALANQIRINHETNRPLPSSNNPHFQNEARCTTFLVKMSFICMRMKNDFHIKGWAPTLVLKQKPGVGNGLFWIHLTNQNSKQVHAAGPKGGKTFWSISETQLLSDPINQSKLKAGACSWRYARENV